MFDAVGKSVHEVLDYVLAEINRLRDLVEGDAKGEPVSRSETQADNPLSLDSPQN